MSIFVVDVKAQQQFIQVVSKANSYCNSVCTLLDVAALNKNTTAIILATPVIENGVDLNPHPIGVHYIKDKWSIINLDQTAMATGSKFNVQYFSTPDPDLQFVQRADEKNLREKNTRSYIDNRYLNNNPEAQFQFIITGAGSGSVISEMGVKYDNTAAQWYLYNTNGKALDNSVACNIVISSKGKTSAPVTLSQPAAAATTAMFSGHVRDIFMSVEGVHQGKFRGETSYAGQSGKSELTDFNLETDLPIDVSSGLATGKHINKPIIVTKLFGPASLQLYQALLTNESLITVTFEFYASDNNGINKLVNSIKLTDAHLISFKQNSVLNDVELLKKGMTEELKFSYQKIEMKDAAGLVVADNSSIQN
ncbi:MAG: type VI secretion system tube protein TssD [Ferruginibacter sp.]